eukprot:TRINITY_DN12161_c0_g1_i9.p1 TRINITY_DN12161_c0_g1~~TRINITY_DN12161_c0_g1_i9.p1  ORF type:complete len:226 (+),score=25.67 TRINITY_DN12161_c0_g1_i9:190-867(+)
MIEVDNIPTTLIALGIGLSAVFQLGINRNPPLVAARKALLTGLIPLLFMVRSKMWSLEYVPPSLRGTPPPFNYLSRPEEEKPKDNATETKSKRVLSPLAPSAHNLLRQFVVPHPDTKSVPFLVAYSAYGVESARQTASHWLHARQYFDACRQLAVSQSLAAASRVAGSDFKLPPTDSFWHRPAEWAIADRKWMLKRCVTDSLQVSFMLQLRPVVWLLKYLQMQGY